MAWAGPRRSRSSGPTCGLRKDLAAAFAGVDVLVHLAAAVTGGEDAQFAATVVGTERLLDAMARSQTRRLVLASSFSVYDWSAIRGDVDRGVAAGVGRRPLRARRLRRREGLAGAGRPPRGRVRTAGSSRCSGPASSGGGATPTWPASARGSGRVHLVFGGSTRIPLTHVVNCADLFATAAEDPRAIGETFNVVDDDEVRVWGYLGEYLRRSGVGGVRVPVPYPGDGRRPPGAVVEPADLPGQGEAAEPARPLPVRGPLQAAPVQQPQGARGPGLAAAPELRRLPSPDVRGAGRQPATTAAPDPELVPADA